MRWFPEDVGTWGRLRRLLRVRAISWGRGFGEVGREEPAWALVLGVLGAAGAWVVWRVAGTPSGGLRLALAALALLGVGHGLRRDHDLLRQAGYRPWLARGTEYLLLVSPVSALLAIRGHGAWAAGLLAGALLIGAGRPGGWALPDIRRRPIRWPRPELMLESLSGLRAAWPGLTLLYLIAVPFSGHPALWGVVFLAVTWIMCGFYVEGEGLAMLMAPELPPGRFLRRKVGRALGAWTLLVLPLILLHALRGGTPLTVGIALGLGAGTLAASVVLKYAVYAEGRGGGILRSLAPVAFTAAAFLPPLWIAVMILLWRRATLTLAAPLRAFA